MSAARNPLGRKTQTILLQAAKAMPWSQGHFAIRPEHVGKTVWVLPEQPVRQTLRSRQYTRRATMPCHAVVIECDGSICWPTTRAAPRGSLELRGEFRKFTLPRYPPTMNGANRTEHVKPLMVRDHVVRQQLRYPQLVLSGSWLARAGFPTGALVLREVVKPGVLVLRVVAARQSVMFEENDESSFPVAVGE